MQEDCEIVEIKKIFSLVTIRFNLIVYEIFTRRLVGKMSNIYKMYSKIGIIDRRPVATIVYRSFIKTHASSERCLWTSVLFAPLGIQINGVRPVTHVRRRHVWKKTRFRRTIINYCLFIGSSKTNANADGNVMTTYHVQDDRLWRSWPIFKFSRQFGLQLAVYT